MAKVGHKDEDIGINWLYQQSIGNGVFEVVSPPNGTDILFVWLDKHGYFNIFEEFQDFLDYWDNNPAGCKRVCIEGEEVYEEFIRNYNEPIGAQCQIKYLDNDEESSQYFSFVGMGENDGEEHEHDAAGIPDHDIFYFADKGESEIKELMQAPSDGCMNDFIILSYELRYRE